MLLWREGRGAVGTGGKPHPGRIGKRIEHTSQRGGDPKPVLKGEGKVGSLAKGREEAAGGRGHRMSKNQDAPLGGNLIVDLLLLQTGSQPRAWGVTMEPKEGDGRAQGPLATTSRRDLQCQRRNHGLPRAQSTPVTPALSSLLGCQ